MKFRCRMTEMLAIKKFYTVLNTISKMAKTCVFRLSQDRFFFIVQESSPSSPSIWVEMEQIRFFNEYNLEGVNDESPHIYIEIEPDQLTKALHPILKSTAFFSLKFKLTKKRDRPCLSLEIEDRLCVHDIPVNLIPRKHWQNYQEPYMPIHRIGIFLPPLKNLKHIVERYKNLGNHMILEVDTTGDNGKLKLKLESDSISLGTYFQDLEVPKICHTGATQPQQVAVNGTASVKIELRRFNLFLHSEQINPRKVIANFVNGKMIHIFIVHDDVFMQYFIPAIVEE
ncbi:checkpoint protein HUS1 isoform X2 [Lepeophtheirus salmonis]|uniref:Checkpoint protein n=1 Tax=Lepeophtheirus salmonis TaxID=72036 RepID=A0A0K2U3Z5_LEPSM|nr:checkpoint protein HUS1-like [Lepeophtheirus salmonis]XP_040578696.1 checkpoint protein HUS1-like [Lepeophtheirus salmonis]